MRGNTGHEQTTPATRLIVFARQPRAGRVKTRLAAAIGAAGAANLHAAFVTDLVTRLAPHFPLAIYATPNPDTPFFQTLAAATGARLARQVGGDLGARMAHALRTELENGAEHVLLIGSDLPTLPVFHLHRAVELLASASDVVFGPAADGGFYLVGVPQGALGHWPGVEKMFDGVPWSTPSVLSDTLARAADTALRVAFVPSWYDVDTPADLERLTAWLHDAPPKALPCTRAVLAELSGP
ncbi:MAG: TIGR04282 family arsenosugar biosynthesis glycosyltransferase [Nitrospirota bacterium]|nr:TIGR04282 family arsenosugar biosynthesis glycosyltransferase [Nitrospirota bacterium]